MGRDLKKKKTCNWGAENVLLVIKLHNPRWLFRSLAPQQPCERDVIPPNPRKLLIPPSESWLASLRIPARTAELLTDHNAEDLLRMVNLGTRRRGLSECGWEILCRKRWISSALWLDSLGVSYSLPCLLLLPATITAVRERGRQREERI